MQGSEKMGLYRYHTVEVFEELWEVEELRNELLDICACLVDGLVGTGDGEKLAVGVVKFATLEIDV